MEEWVLAVKRRMICFDPGQTSGYAEFAQYYNGTWHLVVSGQFPTWSMLSRLIMYVHSTDDFVIAEKVQVTSGKTNPWALKVLAVIEYLCEERNVQLIHQVPGKMQGPYSWPDTKLILEAIKGQPHARDSIAHGLAYIKSTGGILK